MENFYKIVIGTCERNLKLIKTETGAYYSYNMLGDCTLNQEAAQVLGKLIDHTAFDAIVTVESKAIALVQELAVLLRHKKYVVIRKSLKSYMTNVVSVSGSTIISGSGRYFIDGADVEYLQGKRILVVDDVISTCGTIDAVYRLLSKCELKINAFACVLCEGTITQTFQGIPVISCGFIPLPEINND